jgi:N-acetylglucosaminyl-diphospho-decaprenol L-rhamnosyltransferase
LTAVQLIPWAAVVVNHDGGHHLETCVRSLLALGAGDARPEQIVVVDNASSDGSADALAAAFAEEPAVRVVWTGANLGYASGANRGIAATRTPVVAVLNADTVVQPGAPAAVLRCLASDERIGAVGPRILEVTGEVYPSARHVPSFTDAAGHGLLYFVWRDNPFTRRYRQTDADPTTARDVDWLSGSALWLRRAALDDIGGWDERYFMYLEDVDLGWRLGHAGWRVVYDPEGAVVHVGGASTSRRPYRMALEHHRSMWRFSRRRFTGARRVALPAVGALITARAGASLVDVAWRRARDARRAAAGR